MPRKKGILYGNMRVDQKVYSNSELPLGQNSYPRMKYGKDHPSVLLTTLTSNELAVTGVHKNLFYKLNTPTRLYLYV